MRILVTGATGFIGRHLLRTLKHSECTCCAVTRSPGVKIEGADEYIFIDLLAQEALKKLPTHFDAIVHLADGLSSIEQNNIPYNRNEIKNLALPTINLAKWALNNNVRDFIYVSSVKAMLGKLGSDILTNDKMIKPNGVYGIAKRYIESQLKRVFSKKDSRLIILRNPSVHGPGCTSNIKNLLHIADTPWPLPLKRLESYRSTVSVTNSCDAIKTVLDTPDAPGGTYMIADDGHISAGDIINVFRKELGRKSRLFTIPGWFWKLANTFPGIKPFSKRLNTHLIISDKQFRTQFRWMPSQTTQQSLKNMARVYADKRKNNRPKSVAQ